MQLFSLVETHPNSLFPVLDNAEGKLVYLLFEQALFPTAKEFWDTMQYRDDVQWCSLVAGTPLAYLEKVAPMLVSVTDGNPGETLYYWLCENEDLVERFGFVGVFDGSFESLAQHWQPWVNFISADEKNMMLRFYDEKVLPRWFEILTPAQKLAFIGQHEAVYYPIREDGVIRLRECEIKQGSVKRDELSEEDAVSFPITLTQEQHDQFYYPEQLQRIIDQTYRKIAPNSAWILSREKVAERFYEGMEIATQRYRDVSKLDAQTFALYRFYIADRFYEHPLFLQMLGHFTLRKAIGKFYEKVQAGEVELEDYRTEFWLDIEGEARLLP